MIISMLGNNNNNFATSKVKRTEYKNILPFKHAIEKDVLQISFKSNKTEINSLLEKNPFLETLSNPNVQQWLNQFESPEDKKLVLKMLENFEYYNTQRARNTFYKLHNILLQKIGNKKDDMSRNKIAFFYPGHAKSGAYMCYLYSQANNIKVKGTLHKEMKNKEIREEFYSLEDLENKKFVKNLKKNGVENIVVIDDLIINGGGLNYYLTPKVRDSFKKFKKIYFLNLITGPIGRSRLKNGWPERNAEKIDNLEFIYDKEVLNFDDKNNNTFTAEEKVQIQNLLDKYTNKIEPALTKKFDRSKSLIGFDWNTPGTTPLIFCYTNQKWQALMQRYSGDIGAKR